MKIKIAAAAAAGVLIAVFLTVKLLQRGDFFYAGTVEATEVDLSARVTGVIETINANEGEDVKAGDLLLKISVEDIDSAVNQYEREYKRAKELLKSGSMNQSSFDKIYFERENMLIKQGWSKIHSPLNATVLVKYREPGEMVTPGVKLLTLAELDRVWAYIYVAQPMLAKISLGQEFKCFVPESDIKELKGKVVRINDEAEFTPKNVQTRAERTRLVYGIKVEFENTTRRLKPGMVVELKLPN